MWRLAGSGAEGERQLMPAEMESMSVLEQTVPRNFHEVPKKNKR